MIRSITRNLRTTLASLALTGVCVLGVPLYGDCPGDDSFAQDPDPATPVIPLPPPGQYASEDPTGTPVPVPIP